MVVQDPVQWQEVYRRFVLLEAEMRQLRILLLALQPAGAIVSRHPVPLGGIWAGSDITDDLIESGRTAMFPYEREAFEL